MDKKLGYLFFLLILIVKVEGSSGIRIIAGGRYDDMRMCVGSDAGVKGGPIADIMYIRRFEFKSEKNLVLEIPVMRPILFGTAFKMLQFEPAVSVPFIRPINSRKSLVIAPSIGLSFHYGPDYKADLDNRKRDFFALGPYMGAVFGVKVSQNSGKPNVYGLRLFYTPLFSSESNLSPGTVLGLALDFSHWLQ